MLVDVAGPADSDPRWVVRLPTDRSDAGAIEESFAEAIEGIGRQGGGHTQLWIPEVDDVADALANRHGFSAYRDLWQLRAPLPIPGDRTDLAVRAFDPARDIDELVRVNARAFAWHPEQGRLSGADVQRAIEEPWFSAAGFLLHHIDGHLAGFCWTKIHRESPTGLGEIYVIAIDPAFHGRGLGRPMTQAGLDHLVDEGLETAMLYVESDNAAANRVYDRLGFVRHHTDRAYTTEL